jgi:hypothetical protein
MNLYHTTALLRETGVIQVGSIAVSYWAGTLPKISNLHFASFKFNNNKDFKYILFLDNDVKLKSMISQDLMWLLNEPWFEVRYFSLTQMMNEFKIANFSKWHNNLLYKIFRKFKNIMFKVKISVYSRFKLFASNRFLRNNYNSEIGISFSHNQKFTGLSGHLTYRSDVFRSLIAGKFPNDDVLYVDIDICFVKPFDAYNWSKAFTSPWGLARFANTAIIFFPFSDQTLREKILFELKQSSAAWPWILYSKEKCEFFGLELRRIEDFDPPWAPSNPSTGNSSSFMKKLTNSQGIVDWVDSNSFCFHWHNQWNAVPEEGSAYDIYSKRYKV